MPDPNQPLASTQKPLGGASPITSVSPVVVEEKPPKPAISMGTTPPPPPTTLGTVPPPPPLPSVIGGPKPEKKPDKKVEPAVFPPGGKPKKKKGKIIATILVLAVLVVGGVSATILVRQQQNIGEKASTGRVDGECLRIGEKASDCASGVRIRKIGCSLGFACKAAAVKRENGECLQGSETSANCKSGVRVRKNNCTSGYACKAPVVKRENGECLQGSETSANCKSGVRIRKNNCTSGYACKAPVVKRENGECLQTGETSANCKSGVRVRKSTGCTSGYACSGGTTSGALRKDGECLREGETAANCISGERVAKPTGCTSRYACKASATEGVCTSSTRGFTTINSKITIIQSDFNKCPGGTLYINRYKCPGASTMPTGGCNAGGTRIASNLQKTCREVDFVTTCGCEQIDIGCSTGGSPGYISACNSASCEGGSEGEASGENGETTLTCQCLEIKAFDSEDTELAAEDLADLAVGDVVKFAVRGSASTGAITKARFTVNGTLGTEITGKQEINGVSYYVETYTIPDDVTTFSIKAELYHPTAGWF